MAITAGYTFTCSTQDCVGGVAKLWVVDKDKVASWTPGTTGIYSAAVMTNPGVDVFFEFEFQDFTGEFRQTSAPNEGNCGYTVTQEIEATFQCQDVLVRNALEELMSSSCCGMVAVIELFDGTKWTVGELSKRHLKVLSTTGTTGKALADSSNVVLVLQAITTELAHKFTGSVPV